MAEEYEQEYAGPKAPLEALADELWSRDEDPTEDDVFEAFATWAADEGKELWPHQEEAVLSLMMFWVFKDEPDITLLGIPFSFKALVATPIAFILSVIVNYLICVFWVFDGAREQSGKSKAAFFLTSAAGLVLNEVLMLLFRVILGEDAVILTFGSRTINMYVLNKCMATLIVMIWNYFSKRAVLYTARQSND